MQTSIYSWSSDAASLAELLQMLHGTSSSEAPGKVLCLVGHWRLDMHYGVQTLYIDGLLLVLSTPDQLAGSEPNASGSCAY